jgi:hypothetical protein
MLRAQHCKFPFTQQSQMVVGAAPETAIPSSFIKPIGAKSSSARFFLEAAASASA